MVGVFDAVPDGIRQQFGHKEHLTVADVFQRPEIWQPAVDPLMTRLSLKIRHWQIGGDADKQSGGSREARAHDPRCRVRVCSRRARRAAGPVLGVDVRRSRRLPIHRGISWPCPSRCRSRARSWSNTPRRPARRTARAGSRSSRCPRRPIGPEVRARDLVLRMLAAKVHGSSGDLRAEPVR